MYLSKKMKIGLTTGIPAGLIVVSAAVTWPIVAIKDKQINEVLNDQLLNYIPTLHKQQDLQTLANAKIIAKPSSYSIKFFAEKIANQPIKLTEEQTNKISSFLTEKKIDPKSVTNTNDLLFFFRDNSKGIDYEIDRVWLDDVENPTQPELKAAVKKTYLGRQSTYQLNIDRDDNQFVDITNVKKQQDAFIETSAINFKEFFAQGDLLLETKGVTSTDISQYQKENLALATKNNNFVVGQKPGTQNSFLVDVGNETSFLGPFNFDSVTQVEFSFGDDTGLKIWNTVQAWPLKADQTLDYDNSEAIKFLKENKDKLLLPPNLDQSNDAALNKALENYLFNPKYDPYTYLSTGQNRAQVPIPKEGMIAVLVQLKLGESTKYVVVWQNIVQSAFADILANAPELNFTVVNRPTKEELEKTPENFIKPEDESQILQGLRYRVLRDGLKVNNEDPNNPQVDVTIEISLTDDATRENIRTYEQTSLTGLKGQEDIDFDKLIEDILSGTTDSLTKLTPKGTLTGDATGKSVDETLEVLRQAIANGGNLDSLVDLAKSDQMNEEQFGKLTYKPVTVTKIMSATPNKDDIMITYELRSKANENIQSSLYPQVNVIIQVATKP